MNRPGDPGLGWLAQRPTGRVELRPPSERSTLGESTFLEQDVAYTRALPADLLDMGFEREIEMRDVKQCRVRRASKRGRELPANLWQALDEQA